MLILGHTNKNTGAFVRFRATNRRNRVQFSLLISGTLLKPTWRGSTCFFFPVSTSVVHHSVPNERPWNGSFCLSVVRNAVPGASSSQVSDWTAQLTETKRKLADADRPARPNDVRQSDSPCTWPLVAILVSYSIIFDWLKETLTCSLVSVRSTMKPLHGVIFTFLSTFAKCIKIDSFLRNYTIDREY